MRTLGLGDVTRWTGLVEDYVTTVVRREIVRGHEQEFDAWLKRFIAEERRIPGFLTATVIVPSGEPNVRYIVHHYSSSEALVAWEASERRQELIAEAGRYSVPHFERATGMEAWFTLPENALPSAPPRWKMALVLLGAATLVSTITRYVLGSYLAQWPVPLDAFASAVILVVTLTYALMPALTRALRSWLFPSERVVAAGVTS